MGRILSVLFILSFSWLGLTQAAAPATVLVDPTTYVLIRPTAAQFANANNLTGGGGGGYIFTASDFNESGSTISLDYANGQKATSLIPGFLSAADWVTFNAKAPTASPTFTGIPIAPTAAVDTNTTQLATTAFVIGQGYLKSATAASTYQGLDSDLTAIAALATTSFGRGLLAETSASSMRTTLALVPGVNVLAYPTGTPDGTKFIRDDGTFQTIPGGGDALTTSPLSQFAATTSAQLAGVLSDEAGSSGGFVRSGYLGTAALEAATAFQPADADLTTYANITPSANVQSLLGAADYAAMRTQLSLVPGTNVQAYDADLTTYAGITPSANIQTFLGAANYAAMRTQLGLLIGTDVQAYDSDLSLFGAITPSANTQTFLGAANYAAMRTQLGLVIGTDVQSYDADLTTWAGVTPGTGIAAALATNVGSAGAPVLLNGAAGTPSSIDLTNATNLPTRTVAQGGTGLATLTANNIITGNGTGSVTFIAPGSSGNVLTSNGTAWTSSAAPSGMGGNYTVTGNVVASSGNVTINSATDANIVLAPAGTGETRLVGPGNVTGDLAVGGNLAVTGNSTFATVNATTFNPAAIMGATGNLQVWIGNSTTGNFTKGNLVEGAGTTLTKGATDITVGSTDARNFIVGNVTVTTNATGNITLAAGDGVTLTGNNTDKSITINATASGSGAETGDIKFILDSASVPSGWALTGVNGIPAFTTPDADYKAVMKMAGTVATPTFSPPAGAVASGTVITISSATSGVTFMTTNNTTDPSRSVGTAGGTWTINGNQTIESMGYKDGAYLIDSAVASATYTISGGSPAYYYSVGWDVDATGGANQNIIDANYAGLCKVTLPSAGTVTKLGIYIAFANASSNIKFALFDSGRTLIGSGVSGTIASGDAQWHDITASVSVPSSGTYYIGFSMDGPYDGSLVGKLRTESSGDLYDTSDSGSYGNFPGSLTGLVASLYPWAVRAELTP